MLKRLVAFLPARAQLALRRLWYAWRLRLGLFSHDEPEFQKLSEWVSEGDCVIDVGANVGMFTAALSRLAGANGHVYAFEPIPDTFQLLTANSRLFAHTNVTLVNAAASDASEIVTMEVPKSKNGLPNIYLARIVERTSGIQIFAFPVDSLSIPQRVTFCKVDVEGHELRVLKGMSKLLREHAPTLVVEGNSADVSEFLKTLGYSSHRIANSPNTIFRIER